MSDEQKTSLLIPTGRRVVGSMCSVDLLGLIGVRPIVSRLDLRGQADQRLDSGEIVPAPDEHRRGAELLCPHQHGTVVRGLLPDCPKGRWCYAATTARGVGQVPLSHPSLLLMVRRNL
jgi:hypothetical protein